MVRTFGIIPAGSGPMIFSAALSLLMLAVIALFIFISYSSQHARFEVSDQGLRITGGIYGRFIPREAIDSQNIQVINLNTSTDYKPGMRTNGTSLPGYSEGWFRLKNKEKALLFVTDRSSVVYIPTNQDYSVMLSVSQPDEFLESLKLWK